MLTISKSSCLCFLPSWPTSDPPPLSWLLAVVETYEVLFETRWSSSYARKTRFCKLLNGCWMGALIFFLNSWISFLIFFNFAQRWIVVAALSYMYIFPSFHQHMRTHSKANALHPLSCCIICKNSVDQKFCIQGKVYYHYIQTITDETTGIITTLSVFQYQMFWASSAGTS